jgi:uncharacterized Zn finger protein
MMGPVRRDELVVLPDAVHAALVAVGVPLAFDPSTTGTTCTYPRAGGRCVHVLATYYEIARRLDERYGSRSSCTD